MFVQVVPQGLLAALARRMIIVRIDRALNPP